MAEYLGDKTHAPTPRRRQKAREEGRVARSQDLVSAVLLIAGLLAIYAWGGDAVRWLSELASAQWSGQAWMASENWNRIDGGSASQLLRGLVFQAGRLLLPFLALILLTAVAANLGQIGFLFVPRKAAMDVKHISPGQGFQRIFSGSSWVRLGFGVLKVVAVSVVGLASLWAQRDQIFAMSSAPAEQIGGLFAQLAFSTCLKMGVALLILGLLDFAYQRWKHEQELRMTHEELREELRTVEGDPQLATRRKQVQRQLVLNRFTAAVAQADLVVIGSSPLAAALRYDPQSTLAPILVAKGTGTLAQRIQALARENDIPLVKRNELARALCHLGDVNQPIPGELYAAAAEAVSVVRPR